MYIWIAFFVLIILCLAIDLGVFNKNPHVIETKEASIWTSVWVSLALVFSGVIYLAFKDGWMENPTNLTPQNAVIKYITGYLIEISLSVDNIFVIALIFSSFKIPPKYQHEVLFWGILGAVVFRGLMILFGVSLIHQFHWIIYVFGAFLLYTAIKMIYSREDSFDPKTSKIFLFLKHFLPISHEMHEDKFFIVEAGKKMATPLFLALIVIELTDVLFALDSIPAVLSISSDPFIVFSSNIFAVLGLRSMFFLVSRMLEKFRYINYSLTVILGFVGLKMILSDIIEFSEWLSLSVILVALLGGILASRFIPADLENEI